jgi:hypothetical protein
VRSALIWLGEADPVESIAMSRADAPERNSLLELLSAWAETIGTEQANGITIKDAVKLANETKFKEGHRRCAGPT